MSADSRPFDARFLASHLVPFAERAIELPVARRAGVGSAVDLTVIRSDGYPDRARAASGLLVRVPVVVKR